MKKYRPNLMTFVFIVFAIFAFTDTLSAKEKSSPALNESEITSKVSKLSLPFIPNQGQIGERVKFYANTFWGRVFVTETGEIIYSLPKMEREEKTPRQVKVLKGWVLKEELVGGSIKGVKGEVEATTKVSYFIGNDSSRWRRDIPTYGIVSIGEVYEGINVKLRAYGRSVEKVFYIKAGIDPGSIRLSLKGGESFRVNEEGELVVKTSLGDVKFSKPLAYQEINNRRVEVAVNYDFSNSEPSTTNPELTYGFKMGDYDRTSDLIIDPLLQSTYLGGNDVDGSGSIAIDSNGNVYISGNTYSTNFPGTTGGAQETYAGGYGDAFVYKLNSDLTTILQSTYLGGNGDDYANSITIYGGNVYVAGNTNSTNFPGTTGGAQSSFGGGSDAFVTKLNSGLTAILQSTYLGGDGDDRANSIAIDSSGNVYAAGNTTSTDFPGTTGGAQPSQRSYYSAFVSKLNSDLTAILQSTYLGGDGDDYVNSITIYSGNVYVTGYTTSTNFPGTTGGAQETYAGNNDAFVTKLNSDLTTILQSTYLGGTGGDYAESIAIDSCGNVYVTGFTVSIDFPGTAGGAQPSNGGPLDAFVSKLNSDLTTILQSTYLGAIYFERAYSIAIDSTGNVYVAGYTESTNFPGTTGGAQETYGGGYGDAFVSMFNSDLTAILQSTYLGGSGVDVSGSIAIDSIGNVYVAGFTVSTNFPGTIGGAQPSFGGGTGDAFVAKFSLPLYTGVNFWAMNAGNYWEYNGNDLFGNSWILRNEVTGPDTTTPISEPKIQTYLVKSYKNALYSGSVWYSINLTEIKDWGEEFWGNVGFGQEWITVLADTGLVWAKNPILVGDHWITTTTGTISGSTGWSIPLNISMDVTVQSYDFVTVPLGTYKAYKLQQIVHVENYGYGINRTNTRYGWFVPYLGIVKLLDMSNNSTGVLSSMEISTVFIDLVTEYYNNILDRAPEQGGAEAWADEIERIMSLGIDINEGFIAVGKSFFNSAEYLLMAKTNAAYVTDLYETFMQRPPVQAEIDYWVGYLTQGMSRNILLYWFVYSAEFKLYMEGIFGGTTARPENNLVNDLYRGILNRLPDTAGFNAWLGLMRAAQCAGSAEQIRDLSHQIALGFIQSGEYVLRARTNSEYVGDLYDAILRRGALPSEVSAWETLLNTATREQVLQGFTDSPEFQIRVQEVIDAGCL